MRTPYQPVRAIVISNNAVVYGDGYSAGPPVAGLLDDLPRLLDGAAVRFRGEGVLMIAGLSVDELRARIAAQLPAEDDPLDPDEAPATAPSWSAGSVGPWTSFYPSTTGGAVVHVGLLDELPWPRTPLLHPDDPPGRIAALLDAYHQATGSPWHGTGGISGHGGIRSRYDVHVDGQLGGLPLFRAGMPKGVRPAGGPIVWRRPLPIGAAGWVHVFDINAQYLSACRNALLPWSALHWSGPMPYDPTPEPAIDAETGEQLVDEEGNPIVVGQGRTGFWLVDAAGLLDADGPPLFHPRRVVDGAAWLSTPQMRYLLDRGISPEVRDSYTCQRGEYLLRAWAERLRDARAKALTGVRMGGRFAPVAERVLAAVKATYSESVGLMAHKGGRIDRSDWSMLIQDQARVSELRRLDRVRAQVSAAVLLRVNRDEVSYLSPRREFADLAAALGVSDGMGNFKYVRTYTVAQWAAESEAAARESLSRLAVKAGQKA